MEFAGKISGLAVDIRNPQVGGSSVEKELEGLGGGSDLSDSEVLGVGDVSQGLVVDIGVSSDDSSIFLVQPSVSMEQVVSCPLLADFAQRYTGDNLLQRGNNKTEGHNGHEKEQGDLTKHLDGYWILIAGGLLYFGDVDATPSLLFSYYLLEADKKQHIFYQF